MDAEALWAENRENFSGLFFVQLIMRILFHLFFIVGTKRFAQLIVTRDNVCLLVGALSPVNHSDKRHKN